MATATEIHNMALRAEQCNIPDHMMDGLIYYVLDHRPVGQFLTAVLSNDLMGAAAHADPFNLSALHRYARFLYNHAPSGCYGSREKVEEWLRNRETSPSPMLPPVNPGA